MKEHNRRKVVKYFIPMLSAGLAVSLIQNHDLVIKLTEIPFHSPGHPNEEPYYPDYIGLIRDKTSPAATGTSTVLTIGENNFDSQPY